MKRIVFYILLSCSFILFGCQEQPSEKVSVYLDNYEIIGEEKEKIIGKVSDTIYESVNRSNTQTKQILLDPIGVEGEETTPPEGRYLINGGQSGNVYVYDEDGVLLIHEILDSSNGVDGITVNLNGSHTIRVDGLEFAAITPVPTQISNELKAGIWEVGKDIESGSYSVFTPAGYGVGDLQVFESGEPPRLFEFLDASPDSKVEVDLKDGQKLKITGLSLLQFEPQS